MKEILCTVCENQGFALFSSSRLLSSILEPLGSLSGTLFAPKMAETCLEISLGAPKSRSRALFFGLGRLQERPKRPPRAFREVSRNKGVQDAPKKPPRLDFGAPGDHFGQILEPSGIILAL